MKKTRLIVLLIVSFSLMSTTTVLSVKKDQISNLQDDFDPLLDLEVTVEINKIRSLEKIDQQIPAIEIIDLRSDPDFYVKVFINDQEFKSEVWPDTKYLYDIGWSATFNVPDDEEFVDIKIQLWDQNSPSDRLCDISKNGKDVELKYSIKTGHWTGDDERTDEDLSGYGRLNGCDDGSIYRLNRDCEMWFNIYQNDYDGDGIPYWIEVNEYGTDPEVSNIGDDSDNDDVPIEWEWKWGFDPTDWDNHKNIDPEPDGLDNVEEYLTSQWGSDPYTRDLFIELDQMGESPRGEKSQFPERSKELLYTAFDRQNIIYHLDDGKWDETGSEIIPFDEATNGEELDEIYIQYFLHQDSNNWRKGVFHYSVLVYNCTRAGGHAFRKNSFQMSSKYTEEKARNPILNRDIVFASGHMHETGHTLGFWWVPGHSGLAMYPWQIMWWVYRSYKSCMNYGYVYRIVDYSDGSRFRIDLDDWERMDLTYFQSSSWP